MAFFWFFWAKNAVFGDGGSEKLGYLLQNLAKHLCLESSTLKIGCGALQLTTHAPKTLFWAKKCLFLAILGQKNAVVW